MLPYEKVPSHPCYCPHTDLHQHISMMSLELVNYLEVRLNNLEILNRNTKYSSSHVLKPNSSAPLE